MTAAAAVIKTLEAAIQEISKIEYAAFYTNKNTGVDLVKLNETPVEREQRTALARLLVSLEKAHETYVSNQNEA